MRGLPRSQRFLVGLLAVVLLAGVTALIAVSRQPEAAASRPGAECGGYRPPCHTPPVAPSATSVAPPASPSPSPSLALTGPKVNSLHVSGFLLIALGLAMYVSTRRRRPASRHRA